MYTELNNILGTDPETFTQGEFVVISDRKSDASFLIHHFLSFYLRARCKVLFVGLVQSFNHYSAVSQRLGVNLALAKEKGQLVFLEGLNESLSVLIPQESHADSCALGFLRDPAVGLRSLYESIQSGVSGSGGGEVEPARDWGPPVLLVDDLSVLLSLGVTAGAVLDFSHYCRATVCTKLQGNVVMLTRCDGENDEEEEGDDEGPERLLKGLTHQCSLTLHVQGLPTGFCRDIHGQVEVCWRRKRGDGQHTHRKLFQYKVHDKGASFFARGTSSAVL